MDATMANEARRRGCSGCVFWVQEPGATGRAAEWGSCVADAPRTGGRAQFPVTSANKFCGAWLPRQDVVSR